jgi:CheY-like chemotaxis protein
MDSDFLILLVEDDPGHALLFERMLRRAGIRNELLHFDHGEAVLAYLAEKHDPSRSALMLLDLRMPVLDGVGVLRRLRADPLLPDVPVIVLSTTLDSAEQEACLAMGCHSFLLKPVGHDTFLKAVRRLGLAPILDLPRPRERRP